LARPAGEEPELEDMLVYFYDPKVVTMLFASRARIYNFVCAVYVEGLEYDARCGYRDDEAFGSPARLNEFGARMVLRWLLTAMLE